MTPHIAPAASLRLAQDRFGRRLAARLDAGAAELPRDITERLRAARAQAVTRRKIAVPQAAGALAAAGPSPDLGNSRPSLWARIAAVLPLLALAAGLIAIHVLQNERRARELAEVDAALLTDDLPPSAYTDPGFVQFLKNDQ
ncbi:DUF3619 family protein [Ramlibacter tataouinensis]|uniref:DUF3619 family protein n=1 Tax=Ramlibacter tataouinensis (strain ATCC BAA-407 / DSM 14655 / LMG 21543 / TTB310) TaxID=365046 RepID=F5Y0J0_RAMTT|nr:DUF3619 family protein [Ramlibacter tataouinensis]AEG93396.1 Conserved hypothetical protein [Ramlibacter tataouinensis TTB310]